MAQANNTVLGVVVMTRHGDRQGFYQDPITYTAAGTSITPLGEIQEYNLGSTIRSLYFTSGSPSVVSTLNETLFDQTQVVLYADAGGEAGVILDSAVAFSQGLWPATSASSTTLANGTTVTSPLGGYQYIPINSVSPTNDISLEGWTNCNAFNDWTNQVYSSPAFYAKGNATVGELESLTPLANGRAVTLLNAYNIFDYINVQSIHNATFAALTTPNQLAVARDLGNFHEGAVFTSPQLNGVGNIAFQTLLPKVLSSLHSFSNASDPLKFSLLGLSYKPFISFFNMTGATLVNPQLAGIVNYASAVTLELRQSTPEPVVRMSFKNGTDDVFNVIPMFGNGGDTPLSQLNANLGPYAISTLGQWCSLCKNNSTRGCDTIAAANASSTASSSGNSNAVGTGCNQAVSPVGAGFIGAGVTLAVILGTLALFMALGLIKFGGRRNKNVNQGGAIHGSDTASDASLHRDHQEKVV